MNSELSGLIDVPASVRWPKGRGTPRSDSRAQGRRGQRLVVLGLAFMVGSSAVADPPEASDRARYNLGTARLAKGDLNEATALLHSVVSGNDEVLQPIALYNLGHARFRAGRAELSRGPDAGSVARQGQIAADAVDPVLQQGWNAVSSGNVDSMLTAYRRGRGVRKDVKAAVSAIRSALEHHETTLTLWRRAAGDFHGVVELRGGDAEAAFNAEVVDRHIARLIDLMQQLSRVARDLGNRRSDLERMLQEMKGRIPQLERPGSSEEEDDEDSEGPQPGQKEPGSKSGREVTLSPEEARRLLQSFRLDRNRILPMGGDRRSPVPSSPARGW